MVSFAECNRLVKRLNIFTFEPETIKSETCSGKHLLKDVKNAFQGSFEQRAEKKVTKTISRTHEVIFQT